MGTAIIIPARLQSTRLPAKPLALLAGVPLVVRVAWQAKKCRNVASVVVATDSAAIRDAAKAHGVEAILTRSDHVSGTDRVAEAARALGAERVVNVQGDEPFIDPGDLEALVDALERGTNDLATLKAPLEDPSELANPNVVKVVCRDDGTALYFSRAEIPFDRQRSGRIDGVFRHVGVYGYQAPALERLSRAAAHPLEQREGLEQLRALAMGMSIEVLLARSITRGIDTEADLAWAQERVQRLGETAFP